MLGARRFWTDEEINFDSRMCWPKSLNSLKMAYNWMEEIERVESLDRDGKKKRIIWWTSGW